MDITRVAQLVTICKIPHYGLGNIAVTIKNKYKEQEQMPF